MERTNRKVTTIAIVGITVLVFAITGCPTDGLWADVSGPTYSVTYSAEDADGGDAPIDQNTYPEGAVVVVRAITGTIPYRDGHTFDGWHYPDSTVTLHAGYTFVMPAADVILAAVWIPDSEAPTPSGWGKIAITDRTNTSITLSWDAATDNLTAEEDLAYSIYTSAEANIGTAANAVTNGVLLAGPSAGLTEFTATGLGVGTSHYFNVVVEDIAGNATAYAQTSVRTTAPEIRLSIDGARVLHDPTGEGHEWFIGDVSPWQASVEKRVFIGNEGDGPLTEITMSVEYVDPESDSIWSIVDPPDGLIDSIQPGESKSFIIQMQRVTGFEGMWYYGRVTISSNDPSTEVFQFRVRGEDDDT